MVGRVPGGRVVAIGRDAGSDKATIGSGRRTAPRGTGIYRATGPSRRSAIVHACSALAALWIDRSARQPSPQRTSRGTIALSIDRRRHPQRPSMPDAADDIDAAVQRARAALLRPGAAATPRPLSVPASRRAPPRAARSRTRRPSTNADQRRTRKVSLDAMRLGAARHPESRPGLRGDRCAPHLLRTCKDSLPVERPDTRGRRLSPSTAAGWRVQPAILAVQPDGDPAPLRMLLRRDSACGLNTFILKLPVGGSVASRF